VSTVTGTVEQHYSICLFVKKKLLFYNKREMNYKRNSTIEKPFRECNAMSNPELPSDNNTDIVEKEDQDIKEPEMYKVLLINDDFTPREFVVEVLVKIYHKSASDSYRIMMTAHRSGQSIVGLYTYDIANTKVRQARQMAKENGYPLRMVVEGA
jgi:ATP-dependent Clp protease adaptor protein ClpS